MKLYLVGMAPPEGVDNVPYNDGKQGGYSYPVPVWAENRADAIDCVRRQYDGVYYVIETKLFDVVGMVSKRA